jgi:hypothetical protein
MEKTMKRLIKWILTVMALAGTFGGVSLQGDVLPNDAVIEGRTIAEWSAEWWKWVSPIRLEESPLFDSTGDFANMDQSTPVFFLAGIMNTSGAIERRFSLREDQYLFFPIENFSADNIDSDPPFTIEGLRDLLNDALALVTEMHASIDGVPVSDLSSHRVASPVFSIAYSDSDNLESFQAGHPFVGLDDPIVSDGYWLMLEPLKPGVHVINFGGTLGPPINVTLDITDTITVVAIPLRERVEELISEVDGSLLAQKGKLALIRELREAESSFAKNHLRAGIEHLDGFEHLLHRHIAAAEQGLADQLRAAAQTIIDKATSQLPGNQGQDHRK